ncbi:hypothetical protein G4G31_14480 [Massilia sp. Se16.2.3]|nr:hypothetical protein G4G31_14480 [Massilia sp. Se16.2.3]
MLQARIGANFAAVDTLASQLSTTHGAGHALAREQIGEMTRSLVLGSPDLIGAAVTFEPNAYDGKDAEYAGKKPHYDDSGRYMPYYTRAANGGIGIEPIVFTTTPGANDWYDIPKASGKKHFTEPYVYPINGKDVLMASMVAPVIMDGGFKGTVSADFQVATLGAILGDMKVIEGGVLTLVSNGGLYASHPDAARLGKKAADIPEAALESIRRASPMNSSTPPTPCACCSRCVSAPAWHPGRWR